MKRLEVLYFEMALARTSHD